MKKIFLLFWVFSIMTAVSVQAGSDIVINEIMYNASGDDIEFVELYNMSTTAINLQNWYLLDDNNSHSPCIINGTLNSGAYLVIASDVTKFKTKYPGISNVNSYGFNTGGTGWSLANGGDVVRLFNSTKTLHDSVTYDDGGEWPGSPDGNGPSLELLHPGLDNALPTSWDPSKTAGGTPGKVNSVFTQNIQPTCKDGKRAIDLPTQSDNVAVRVLAFDNEGLAKVELFINTGSGYNATLMNDNGLTGDVKAGDSLYTAVIPAQATGTRVQYYAVATDLIGQKDNWPNDAPTDYQAYTVDYVPPKLRITEVLAVNNTINIDEAGEYDDWFELYNDDAKSVNLAGMYVSSSLGAPRAFKLPSKDLAPGSYLVIWADDDTDQGLLHANFKLSADGEEVGIFETVDHGNVLIHGWKFGRMSANVSMGFLPESGTAPEYLTAPTPGKSNVTSKLFSAVCINEFQCTSDFGGTDDWIEIYNRGTQPFDLTGCFLSDERSKNDKWTFPKKILSPGEYLVVHEDVLNFGLSSDGDDVIMLTASDTTTGLDFYDFSQQTADHSEGRLPDGSNTWKFFDTPTKGTANNTTGIAEEIPTITPDEFRLSQNYPNPFNPSTKIEYHLPAKLMVSIIIYDITGRQMRNLVHGIQQTGQYSILWNGLDDAGNPVSAGVYLYKIQAGNFTQCRKMVLMK